MSSSKAPSSSLTPQRKHRKLLKDGSGGEVWPESIEKIFVQDYLQKAGIERSKKQVASHIQVLRNMWKGEPEFYLVAGGEEPSESAADASVKLEDSSLIPLDFDENDSSSNSTSPDFSPPEFQSEFPPSPGQLASGYALGSHFPPSKQSVSPYASPVVYTASMPSSMSMYPVDMAVHHSHDQLPIQNSHYSLSSYDGQSAHARSHKHIPPQSSSNHSLHGTAYSQSPSWASSICFLAAGMSPLPIKLDTLMPSPPPSGTAPALHLCMSFTPEDGIHGTSNADGFIVTVSLSRLWNRSGKCITRTFTNGMCTSEQEGTLDVSNIEMGVVNAMLPESALSRCRWLDASIPTRITQDILVDDETVLYLIYDLDRRVGQIPSAKLLRWSTTPKSSHPTPSATSPPPQTTSAYHNYPATTFYTPMRAAHPSVSNPRHIASPSMSF
ncbi:hypothetical protein H0H92_002653 [Tricholoma furcatifolium]|nr:hypothetical protein H0H92_002653 [Tricholoma furcatifolium]